LGRYLANAPRLLPGQRCVLGFAHVGWTVITKMPGHKRHGAGALWGPATPRSGRLPLFPRCPRTDRHAVERYPRLGASTLPRNGRRGFLRHSGTRRFRAAPRALICEVKATGRCISSTRSPVYPARAIPIRGFQADPSLRPSIQSGRTSITSQNVHFHVGLFPASAAGLDDLPVLLRPPGRRSLREYAGGDPMVLSV